MWLVFLAACDFGTKPSTPAPPLPSPDATAGAAASVPGPPLRVGVAEVSTPATILRVQNLTRTEPPRRYDVEFDPSSVTFAALEDDLVRWGFTVEDGDGLAWRAVAPQGTDWPSRLEPLPEVLGVRAATTQDMLPDGSARTGGEHYGTVIRTWSMRAGTLTETLQGSPTPPPPVLPSALAQPLQRCLTPLVEDLAAGEAQGVGWERALDPAGPTWVLVLEHYGACDASGWVELRADGPLDNLQAAGRAAAQVDEAAVFVAAVSWLGEAHPVDDDEAVVARELVAGAPEDVLRDTLPRLVDTTAQEAAWQAWADRDNAAAVAWAASSTMPLLRAHAAQQEPAVRTELLRDTTAPVLARRVAVSGWSPTDADDALVQQLRADRDPIVRAGAWTAWSRLHEGACTARAASAEKLGTAEAARLYGECPQDEVREKVIAFLAQADPAKAGELVGGVLGAPEDRAAGMAAVRAAVTLGRDDLLEQVIEDTTVGRDIRGLALRALAEANRSTKLADLQARHGAYLGVKPRPVPASVAGGP